jgi:hypothetical protein
VKSLWGLKQYEKALEFIEKEVPASLKTNNADFKQLHMTAVKILEQSKGKFDMLEIMSLPREKRHDIGEYTGPVTISPVAGKGRGLVAIDNIAMGQLILSSKAFNIVFNEDVIQWNKKVHMSGAGFNDVDLDNQEVCSGVISEKLLWDKNLATEVFDLCSGPGVRPSSQSIAVYEILKHNAFKSEMDTTPIGNGTPSFCGLWILPSYINHSCMDSNAYYTAYGDFLFIRAVKPIKKGEEVTITYWSPKIPARREAMKGRKFECKCRLCLMEDKEPRETKKKAEIILKLINEGHRIQADLSTQFSRIQELISLRAEYSHINVDLLSLDLEMVCGQLDRNKEWRKYLYILEKMHEVCKYNCFVESFGFLSVNILKKYVLLREVDSVIKWWKQVKRNVIAAYGTIEGLKGFELMSSRKIEHYEKLEKDSETASEKALLRSFLKGLVIED